jgi:hypothetical protein
LNLVSRQQGEGLATGDHDSLQVGIEPEHPVDLGYGDRSRDDRYVRGEI